MIGEQTLRLLAATAAWARGGGHDHRTVRDRINDCADVLQRERDGYDVTRMVDDLVADLEASEDW